MSKQAAAQVSKPFVKELKIPQGINKRCDYPPEAYWLPEEDHTPFARRAKYNTTGQDINVGVNQFRVIDLKNIDISQYDINLTPEPKGAIVYSKVWNSSIVKQKLGEFKNPWLYDNRKLAWSTNNVKVLECEVDLGVDEGRPGRQNNIFKFTLRQTGKIRMAALQSYLKKEMAWDNSVLECISFLDHALRQGPSEKMRLIKRTLVNEYSQTKRLNAYTEAIKGIYSAIRLNESINSGGTGLGINVDVSNQTFWVGQKFEQLVRNFLGCMDRRWENLTIDNMRAILAPVKIDKKDGPSAWGMSDAFKALRKLANVRFEVKHRGNAPGPKEYKVRRIVFDNLQYGQEGAHAKAVKFDRRMEDGSVRKTSIYDYYLEKYKVKLQYWFLPLIETTRAGYFPMEVCEVHRFNPYPYKLDPAQTSEMIRFAVQRPPQRKTEVMQMVQNLNWGEDPYLRHFGIKISPTMPMVKAKLLPSPVVGYGNRTTDPKMTGRWDLRGMRFVLPNKQPLKSWAFVSVDNAIDRQGLENFAKQFHATYAGHGGRIDKPPVILGSNGIAHPQMVENVFNQCGNANKANPQIIFFVLRDKNATVYDRLKRNAECRFGCITQMMQAQHVRKAQGQYMSNVCMKVNAKLGGQTSKVAPGGKSTAFFNVPTMMIGVDVSHGAAGGAGERVSMAAMCVSMDKDAAVYNAAVQTNGYAVEILQPGNMHSMLGPLAEKWRAKHGVKPKHVFYVRDGVSEGQFAHVMQYEVAEMKNLFRKVYGEVPKITVIIATKRHHIRFFPERGDRNGNCLPGTLVEREVTHPFHYDFYLCSHVAIQGTARPVHYNVIHDECGLEVDVLQNILYRQCYQYCRATTPVSLHPAVYYAHLASARAHHHESQAGSVKIPSTSPYMILRRPGLMAKHDNAATATSRDGDSQPPPLLEIACQNARPGIKEGFHSTMWWV